MIAGTAKGHKLKAPKGYSTRPTSDRVKEAVFNIITEHIPNSHVLDLFAGTGSLGIEALSRGAEHVVFVDKDVKCSNIIKENLRHTKLADKAEIFTEEVLRAVSKLSNRHMKFNIIFLDPPYKKNFVEKALIIIEKSGIIDDKGIIVVEHDIDDSIAAEVEGIKLIRNQKYGDTVISFYKIDI